MLEGVLYQLVEKTENGAVLRLLPESPIYAAHFPGYPITPGVTLLQMALECMGRRLKSAKDIKFMVPVLPADGILLRYQWEIDESGKALIQAFLPGDVLCAKMLVQV